LVAGERVDVDDASLDRPKTPTASFVAQISVFVGGADEDALARLVHFASTIGGPVLLNLPGDESLEPRRVGPIQGVHFRNFDQPFAVQVLRHVFAAISDVGQVVGKIFAAENATGGRFQSALRPLDHRHIIDLATRLVERRDKPKVGKGCRMR
jgi:hypothetical protein